MRKVFVIYLQINLSGRWLDLIFFICFLSFSSKNDSIAFFMTYSKKVKVAAVYYLLEIFSD